MFDCNDIESTVGSFCTLLYPWKGQTEGTIIEDLGTEVVVQLINGKETVVYKDDLVIFD